MKGQQGFQRRPNLVALHQVLLRLLRVRAVRQNALTGSKILSRKVERVLPIMPWLVGPATTSQETFSSVVFQCISFHKMCDVSFVLVPLVRVRELFLSPPLVRCEHSLVEILGLSLVLPCDSAHFIDGGDDVVSWRHL